MIRIGLTGGIGMGKSTAARILQTLGAMVVDTDELSRDLVAPGQPALEEVRMRFGEWVIGADGRLERDRLAREIFGDPAARRDLEAILHPRIRAMWVARLEEWCLAGRSLGVVVIPLLFETGAEAVFDLVTSVGCNPGTQARRLGERGWTVANIRQRMEAQWSAERKMALAQRVVWTEGHLDVHVEQWRRVLASIL